MKKLVAAALLASAALSASASDLNDPIRAIARVRAAMKSRVGISNKTGDVRLNVYKIEDGICGSSGNSIIADFQVRKLERAYDDRTGSLGLKSKWETVKTYGIPLAEVGQLTDAELKSEIMDSEGCLE
jgi:hypothetical protein